MTKRILKHTVKSSRPRNAWRALKTQKLAQMVVVAVAVGVLGVIYLVSTHAASTAASVQAESGTVSSAASVVTDSSASGNQAVKFGSGSTGGGGGGGGGGSTGAACKPYPSFPDASCTGPTGTLTPYTGPTNITQNGTVIQNVLITSSIITVNANNVTFKNVKYVYGGATGGFAMVQITTGHSGTVFENCELDGQDKAERAIEGGNSGVTVTDCNIHDTGNAIEVGSNITATDNYMWNIYTPSGLTWHADGIQSGDSASDSSIVHNTILLTGGETGAINFVSNGGGGTFSNILVKNNLMAGGSYTVYAGSSAANNINFQIINNHFSTRYYSKVGQFGTWYPTYLSGITISGNVIDETGAADN